LGTMKVITVFLVVWIGGSVISLILNIKYGLLPSLFLGLGLAIWMYQSK